MGRHESTPRGLGPEIEGENGAIKDRRDAGQVMFGQESEGKGGLMGFLMNEMSRIDEAIRNTAIELPGEKNPVIHGGVVDELSRQRQRQVGKDSRLVKLQAQLERFKSAQQRLLGDDEQGPAQDILNELITSLENQLQMIEEDAQRNIAEIREKFPGDTKDADLWSQEIVRYSRILEETDRPVTKMGISKILDIVRANFDSTKIGLELRPVRELEERLNRLKRLRDSLS